MVSSEVGRTLVKSPPELWSELSDARALSRHLGEFGEIRITRIEPEKSVEWESDSARGTVRIKASGWGTRVTLRVDRELPTSDPTPPVGDEVSPASDEHDASAAPDPAGDEPPIAGEPAAEPPPTAAASASEEQTRAPIEPAAEEPPGELEAVRAPFEQFQPLLPRDPLTVQGSLEAVDDELEYEIEAQEPDPQPREGFLGRLLGRLRRKSGDPSPLAALEDPGPDPEAVPVAQQCGEREDIPEGELEREDRGWAYRGGPEEPQIVEQAEPAPQPGAWRPSTPDCESAPALAAEIGAERLDETGAEAPAGAGAKPPSEAHAEHPSEAGAEPPSEAHADPAPEIGAQHPEQAGLAAELRAAEEVAAEEVKALLTSVLDRLGTAHHRPFSRP